MLFWYGRQDLNLHGCPLEPKSNVSANSTTPACFKLFALMSCCGARQCRRTAKCAWPSPTAATRSGRLIRHRRRSHRSPPRPRVKPFYHANGGLSTAERGYRNLVKNLAIIRKISTKTGISSGWYFRFCRILRNKIGKRLVFANGYITI